MAVKSELMTDLKKKQSLVSNNTDFAAADTGGM